MDIISVMGCTFRPAQLPHKFLHSLNIKVYESYLRKILLGNHARIVHLQGISAGHTKVTAYHVISCMAKKHSFREAGSYASPNALFPHTFPVPLLWTPGSSVGRLSLLVADKWLIPAIIHSPIVPCIICTGVCDGLKWY